MLRLINLILIAVVSSIGLAQENEKPDTVEEPGLTIATEVGGRNFLVGLDLEWRLMDHHRLDIGAGIWAAGGGYMMYHYLIGKRYSKLELGTGITIRFYNPMEESPIILNAWIGYRYHKKNGLMFKAGFTPSYDIGAGFGSLLPLGVGVGYSF